MDIKPRLVDVACIFDIDGTLVDLHNIWETAYNSLYQQTHHFTLTEPEMKSMFGPPELAAHTSILQGRGIYTLQRAEELVEGIEKAMLTTLKNTDTTRYIIDAVIPCLDDLQKENIPLACATGNIKSIASAILETSNLAHYFPVLATSSPTTLHRYQIVASAKQQLEAATGKNFASDKTYVLGDSPSDIRAAKRLGLVSVGVATGHYDTQELAKEEPIIVLESLQEFPKIVTAAKAAL